MPTLPDRSVNSRPRNLGVRSQPRTPNGAKQERGPSSLSSPSQNTHVGRTSESGSRSESRQTDTISQGSPAKDRAVRDDRHDRDTGNGRDGSGSYPTSRIYSGTGSPSSSASRASKEGISSLASRPIREGLSSPRPRLTKEDLSPPASKPTKDGLSSPRPAASKGESNPLTFTATKEGYRTPESRASRGGSYTPIAKLTKVGGNPEEDEGSESIPSSAVKRLGRPSHGTAGYEIKLKTNCFEITLDPGIQLYQYHVSVVPEPKTARQRKQAFDLFLKNANFLKPFHLDGPPVVATDHRSTLITTERIDRRADKEHDRHQCIIAYYEPEEEAPKKTPSIHSHIFTASFCQPLPLRNLMDYLNSTSGRAWSKVNGSILQALSLAVARKPVKITGVTKTNNEHKCFPKAEPLVVLDGGLVALQGFQAGVRVIGSRLFVNVNPRMGIFYREDKEGSLLDLVNEFRKTCKGMEQLQAFVKGIRVSLSHLSTERGKSTNKTVLGLASHPTLGANAQQVSFHWKDEEITVADYYKQRYNISLEVSKAPLVNIGTANRPTHVPPELCKVLPRQMANKSLSPDQQKKVSAALKGREGKAISVVGKATKPLAIGSKDSQGPVFGLEIETSVLTLKGRVLPAPSVRYDGAPFKPDFGSWNLKENRKFTTGAGIKRCIYLQIQNAGKDTIINGLGGFVKGLQQSYASTICELVESRQALTLDGTSPENVFATLDKSLKVSSGKDIEMLLIILPDKRQTLFACIKYLADVKYGIQTIYIEACNLQKHNKQSWYAATIAQKLNTKGGGVNQCLSKDELKEILSSPTMIVGIDMTNPFPKGQANAATSIIGVVASKNMDCAQWPASVRRQDNPDKKSLDLKEMMMERLKCWKKANGALPASILVYRNSVTESHTNAVAKEIKAIEDAIESIYSGARFFPKVTIMTISKSHHTRFYPSDDKAADGQSGNPKVGTVVDREITSDMSWDFYLQSHPGTPKSGTVCPAHYVVIKDDMKLGADGVQQLTNNLCYASGRGTRALSIVPPAHYANLVCERARCYIQASLIPSKECGSGSGTSGSGEGPLPWTKDVHEQLQDSMWYI